MSKVMLPRLIWPTRIVLLGIGVGITLIAIFAFLFALRVRAQEQARIHVEATTAIIAGEPWSLRIQIDGANAGEIAQVTVFHGLRRLDQALVLGTGGVAEWRVAKDQLTSAGPALVVIRFQGIEARQALTIAAAAMQRIDLLSTANVLRLGTPICSTLITLAGDQWGNPPTPAQTAQITVTDQAGIILLDRAIPFALRMGYTQVCNPKIVGRLFASASIDGQSADYELAVLAGEPAQVKLTIDPPCIPRRFAPRLNITLIATVTDQAGNPVVNGTPVRLQWGTGNATSVTTIGRAVLTLPADSLTGTTTFIASAGDQASDSAQVIYDSVCGASPAVTPARERFATR